MGKLTGKVAVVTGGNSGIGLETARRFVTEGADVVITGRRQDALDEAVKSIGKCVTGVQGDVANLADLDRLYAYVAQRFGRIDVLFANAGLVEFVPFPQVSEASFDLQFDVNVKGLFFTVQKALPLLVDGATIILNSSIAGVKGVPGSSAYSATKAAVRSFARTLSIELKERHIRINTLSPGPVETPIFEHAGMSEADKTAFASHIVGQVPLGRIGQADEIAKAAVFLASDDSSFVTGIDLQVDGGLAQV